MSISRTSFFLGGIIVLLLIAAAALSFTQYLVPADESSKVATQSLDNREWISLQCDNNLFTVVVSEKSTDIARGLSGVGSLRDDEGMLFVFGQPDEYGFWMKDMLFDLDMIWLDAQGDIIDIHTSVQKESFPKVFTPQQPASYVLEMNAESAQNYNLNIGDQCVVEGV